MPDKESNYKMMMEEFKRLYPIDVVFDAARELQWLASLENVFFVFTLLAVMFYFFFSYRFTADSAPARSFAYSGRWLLMVCFGAFFGSTVMARMALLVERLQFLLQTWWGTLVELIV